MLLVNLPYLLVILILNLLMLIPLFLFLLEYSLLYIVNKLNTFLSRFDDIFNFFVNSTIFFKSNLDISSLQNSSSLF